MSNTREKKPWPSYVASFMINDMAGACKKIGVTVETCGVAPRDLTVILVLNYNDVIDRKTARLILGKLLDEARQ